MRQNNLLFQDKLRSTKTFQICKICNTCKTNKICSLWTHFKRSLSNWCKCQCI